MEKYNENLTNYQIIAMKKLESALSHITHECKHDKNFQKFIEDLQVFDTVDSMEENLGKVIDNLYEVKL